MTIDEAIEILTIHNDHNPNFTDAERREAHYLGIEALKRLQHYRSHAIGVEVNLLPGETKDKPKTTFDPSISTVSTGEGKMP